MSRLTNPRSTCLYSTGMLCITFTLLLPLMAMVVNAGDNIALDRPYTLEPDPNYAGLEKSDLKRIRLTDGKLAPPDVSMWGNQETVGWQDENPVITIDLGAIQKISGISFRTTACEGAGVHWPKSILILVSEDGTEWNPIGDLVELSNENNPPPNLIGNNAVIHQFVTPELEGEVKARYVKLQITATPPYVFCDEIEIYRNTGSPN